MRNCGYKCLAAKTCGAGLLMYPPKLSTSFSLRKLGRIDFQAPIGTFGETKPAALRPFQHTQKARFQPLRLRVLFWFNIRRVHYRRAKIPVKGLRVSSSRNRDRSVPATERPCIPRRGGLRPRSEHQARRASGTFREDKTLRFRYRSRISASPLAYGSANEKTFALGF